RTLRLPRPLRTRKVSREFQVSTAALIFSWRPAAPLRLAAPGRVVLVTMARLAPAALLLLAAAAALFSAVALTLEEHSLLAVAARECLLTSANPWGRSFLAAPRSEQNPRSFRSNLAVDC